MAQPYERGEVRRRQIVEAALRLLADEGLAAVTTRRIAARLGLTEGALFRHFESKQAILAAGLDHLEALMFSEAAFAPHQRPADPLDELEAFFHRRVALVAGPFALGHLVFSEQLVHATGDAGRRRVAAWQARSASFVRARLEALASQGRLRCDLSPEALVPVVQGQVLGFAVTRAIGGAAEGPPPATVAAAWRTLVTLLLVAPGQADRAR